MTAGLPGMKACELGRGAMSARSIVESITAESRESAGFSIEMAGQVKSRRMRHSLILVLAACALAACGGGSGDSGGTSAASAGGGSSGGSGSATNQAPALSGKPLASVTQDSKYAFTPTASDPDNDPLTFSVSNMPSWASFDTKTGALTGTPGQADVGTYSGITISVSDGQHSVSLGPFSIAVVATATGAATLSWTAPTQRTDGSALTDLAGYKVYWGKSAGNYTNSVTIDNPSVTTYVVENLTPATWYFAATAVDSKGIESGLSNPASKTIN